jgi:hypothetical protein
MNPLNRICAIMLPECRLNVYSGLTILLAEESDFFNGTYYVYCMIYYLDGFRHRVTLRLHYIVHSYIHPEQVS